MKSSKKILGASVALGLAVALSAGSTFAWLSQGNTNVSVDPFDLTATTETNGANLDIAIVHLGATSAPSAYGATAAFEGGALDALKGIALKPLTYNATAGNFEDEDQKTVAMNDPTSANGYITFRLVFRSTAAMNIYLGSDSSVDPAADGEVTEFKFYDSEVGAELGSKLETAGYGAELTNDYTNPVTTGDKEWVVMARAANAARVMFETKNAGAQKKIWSPNEYYVGGKQVADGASDGDNVNEDGDSLAKGFWKGNFASDYNYLKGMVLSGEVPSTLDPANNDTEVEQQDYTSMALTTGETGTLIATTSQASDWVNGSYAAGTDYYAVVDVTIWLEGTDGDCIDSILGDMLSVTLNFVGKEVA